MRRGFVFFALTMLAASLVPSCVSRRGLSVVILGADGHRFSRQIGDVGLVVGCEDALAPEVERLFSHLREISRQGTELVDGAKIPYGWTTFSLRAVRGRLEVWEPDYEHETEQRGRPEISASLKIDAAQRAFMAKVAVESSEIQFDQHLLVSTETWTADEVMLFRVASPGGRMSGWRMVSPHADSEGEALESVPVYELYRRRPELLASLTLPPGYLVYYRDGDARVVMDPSDTVIWKEGAASELARVDTQQALYLRARTQNGVLVQK